MLLSTPGADTPWGTVSRGRFSARLFPATTNGLSSAELSLEAGEAQTRWATTGNLQLTAHLASFEGLTNLGNGNLTLCAGHVETEWGSATNLQLTRSRRLDGGPDESDQRRPGALGGTASRPSGAAPPTPSSTPNGSTP